jgi:hypothetical protein
MCSADHGESLWASRGDTMEGVKEMGRSHELEGQAESMLGDPDAWDVPEAAPARKKSERRQRGAMVSVRMNPEELALVQAAAERKGLSVSAYVRERAVNSVVAAARGAFPTCNGNNSSAVEAVRLSGYGAQDLARLNGRVAQTA